MCGGQWPRADLQRQGYMPMALLLLCSDNDRAHPCVDSRNIVFDQSHVPTDRTSAIDAPSCQSPQ